VPVDPPALADVAQRLGDQLAARRRELGITQEQLAERVGIHRVQIQNIERGYSDRTKRTPSNPRLSTLIALCRELQLKATIDVTSPIGLEIAFEARIAPRTAPDA
jgi:transcriptional regulator with XRE-family HTH domain